LARAVLDTKIVERVGWPAEAKPPMLGEIEFLVSWGTALPLWAGLLLASSLICTALPNGFQLEAATELVRSYLFSVGNDDERWSPHITLACHAQDKYL